MFSISIKVICFIFWRILILKFNFLKPLKRDNLTIIISTILIIHFDICLLTIFHRSLSIFPISKQTYPCYKPIGGSISIPVTTRWENTWETWSSVNFKTEETCGLNIKWLEITSKQETKMAIVSLSVNRDFPSQTWEPAIRDNLPGDSFFLLTRTPKSF